MKKLFCILMAMLLAIAIIMPAMAAGASSWGADVSVNVSMYELSMTRYSTGRDGTGTLGYYAYSGKPVSAGDYVSFSVALKIPSHKTMISRYGVDPGEDGARLQLTCSGVVPVGSGTAAVSSGILSAAIPSGIDVERTLYYGPDGHWHDTLSSAIWTGYVTNALTAGASAAVSYDLDVSRLVLQYGVHDYKLLHDSSGYVAYDNDSAMYFATAKNGLVTGASLSLDGNTWHRLYATRVGYAVDGDSAAGAWAAIASGYFAAFGFSFDDMYAGSVYLTPKNILLHFGPPAESSVSVSWVTTPIGATVLPLTPVAAVPATGENELIFAALLFVLGIVTCVLWPKKGGRA